MSLYFTDRLENKQSYSVYLCIYNVVTYSFRLNYDELGASPVKQSVSPSGCRSMKAESEVAIDFPVRAKTVLL